MSACPAREPDSASRNVICRPSESVRARMSRAKTAIIDFPCAQAKLASFSLEMEAPCSRVAEVGGGSDGPLVEGGAVGGCQPLRAVSVFTRARYHHPPARMRAPIPTTMSAFLIEIW